MGASAPRSTGAEMVLIDVPQSLRDANPLGTHEVTLTLTLTRSVKGITSVEELSLIHI